MKRMNRYLEWYMNRGFSTYSKKNAIALKTFGIECLEDLSCWHSYLFIALSEDDDYVDIGEALLRVKSKMLNVNHVNPVNYVEANFLSDKTGDWQRKMRTYFSSFHSSQSHRHAHERIVIR